MHISEALDTSNQHQTQEESMGQAGQNYNMWQRMGKYASIGASCLS